MENKQFTKDDLKVGYVVKHRDGQWSMVAPTAEGVLVFCDRNGCRTMVNRLTDDLIHEGADLQYRIFDIMEVYGLSSLYSNALTLTTYSRELLWKREEPKKMTVEEIEKELGYKIEIVS